MAALILGVIEMAEPIKLKTKDDYSEHSVMKIIDGKPVEFFDIDAMTEGQWKRYCREVGTECFKRLSVVA
jgi:hypothetical protein